MRACLLIALALAACGGESNAVFNRPDLDVGGPDSGAVGSSHSGAATAGSAGSPASGGTGSSEAGSPAADGGAVSEAGSSSVGGTGGDETGSGGLAGTGGAQEPTGGKAGEAQGGKAGSGGAGGSVASGGKAGAGGTSSEPDVPEACEPCRNNTKAYCDVSSVWPQGQCIACPEFGPDANLYRDCDGPSAEHYVSKNDHDPGYGCETYVGFMGECPD
jgi:hypothetical protein